MMEKLTALPADEVIDRAMSQMMGTRWKVETTSSKSALFYLEGGQWGCGDTLLALILFGLGIVPGLIYVIVKSSKEPRAEARLRVIVFEREGFNVVKTEAVGKFAESAAKRLLKSLPVPDDLLEQGIEAVKQGHNERARQILKQVISQDERNEQAWLWLSGAVKTDEEQRACLEKVLEIDPENKHAIKGLKRLKPLPKEKEVPGRKELTKRQKLMMGVGVGFLALAFLILVGVWWVARSGVPSLGILPFAPVNTKQPLPATKMAPSPTSIPTWTPTPTPDMAAEAEEYLTGICPLMEEIFAMEAEEAHIWENLDVNRYMNSPEYRARFSSKLSDLRERFDACEDKIEGLPVPSPLQEFHRLFAQHCYHYRKALEYSSESIQEVDLTSRKMMDEELKASRDYYERSLQEFGSVADELGLDINQPCPNLTQPFAFRPTPVSQAIATVASTPTSSGFPTPTPVPQFVGTKDEFKAHLREKYSTIAGKALQIEDITILVEDDAQPAVRAVTIELTSDSALSVFSEQDRTVAQTYGTRLLHDTVTYFDGQYCSAYVSDQFYTHYLGDSYFDEEWYYIGDYDAEDGWYVSKDYVIAHFHNGEEHIKVWNWK